MILKEMILCPWESGGSSFDVPNAGLSEKDCWAHGQMTGTTTEITGRLYRQRESDMVKSMRCMLGSVGEKC